LKLKISAILPHLFIFGGVRRYIELGNALISRGHTFEIYTPQGEDCSWLEFKGTVRKMSELKGSEIDVLITGSPEFFNTLVNSSARIKIFYLQIEGLKEEKEIVRHGSIYIMVNSSGLAKRIKRRYGIVPLDGIGGVNTSFFRPDEELGCSDIDYTKGRDETNPLRVLCYGRLSRPRKGTRFVVEAVRRLHRKGIKVELQLFDSIENDMQDPRIGFSPEIPYRFYLNLSQDSLCKMYNSADMFVSAEHRAGWSNTTAEAFACGLPVVCTSSGTSDFAINGKSALVVPMRNSFLIERAISKLYKDPEFGFRIARNAREIIEEYSWERVAQKIEKQLLELSV